MAAEVSKAGVVDEAGEVRRGLVFWTGVGTVCQVIMVIAGHFNEFIKVNVFAFGGMGISLLFGACFGAGMVRSVGGALGGGALVGGGCALLGILLSVVLGDVGPLILLVGTLGSAVTGAVGGGIAQVVTRKKH